MPDLIGLLLYSNTRRVCVGVGSVEQAEFHSRGILGKDGEVDSLAIPCGSQWIGASRPSSHFSSVRICVLVVSYEQHKKSRDFFRSSPRYMCLIARCKRYGRFG